MAWSRPNWGLMAGPFGGPRDHRPRPYSDIVRGLVDVYKPAARRAKRHCAQEKKREEGMLTKTKNYRPSDKEPFMNERQREYFRAKLLAWRDDILKEAKETLQHLQEENQNHPDLADRASSETDRAIELRARDRQRKLIAKIDEALGRIEDGTYGYCEETGEPISLRRRGRSPVGER